MEEELKYSDNALLNLDLFFDNEINFYIEDEGKEYRYETIFNELFNVKIESIFALGGKNNLKKKYKQLKEEERLKKSFFVADLDFDYILKNELIEDDHFIYLEKYEIENYIIDKNIIVKFLKNELFCMENKANELLDYEKWIEDTSQKLYKLFLLYLIVQENNLNIENTSESPYKYFSKEGFVIKEKIENYYEKVKDQLQENSYTLDEKIENMDNRVKDIYGDNWKDIIKGKYYIIGLRTYLSDLLTKENNKKKNISEKILLDYLFDFFDKSSLRFIKDKVTKCLSREVA